MYRSIFIAVMMVTIFCFPNIIVEETLKVKTYWTTSTINGVIVSEYSVRRPTLKAPISHTTKKKPIDTRIAIKEWKGGESLDQSEFTKTIISVFDRMNTVSKDDANFVKLLLETAAIESDSGYYVQQVRGKARGIFQFMMSTVRYLEEDYFEKNPELANDVRQFYDKRHSLSWNIKYNVPYQIAMTVAYYQCRAGENISENLDTKEVRYTYYKKFFNTYKGASTKSKYIQKSSTHINYDDLGDQIISNV